VSGDAPLAFEGVGARFGDREILRGVDLALAPGEILVLAGANGAGKTTLFRIASRVRAADSGRVTMAGRPIDSLSRSELARQLAVVPQEVAVTFPFRVGEVVLMGRSPHLGVLGFETREDVALAEDAMARVGIAELADRSILDLSGGERQLVTIARALTQDPEVLLLDEPTAHLDLRHRIAVLALVREFVSRGRSALVVSHDLNLAARSADRMALLGGGSVLALGTPAEVLTPARLRDAFAIDAEVIPAPDGVPLVIPRAVASKPSPPLR
jgi:iron complex transport system ATP-binding protein